MVESQARDGTGQLPAVGADGVAGTEPDVYMVDEHGDEGAHCSWLFCMCALSSQCIAAVTLQ